jgi:hypothetical protein
MNARRQTVRSDLAIGNEMEFGRTEYRGIRKNGVRPNGECLPKRNASISQGAAVIDRCGLVLLPNAGRIHSVNAYVVNML